MGGRSEKNHTYSYVRSVLVVETRMAFVGPWPALVSVALISVLGVAMDQRGRQSFFPDPDQPIYRGFLPGFEPVVGRIALQGALESDPWAGWRVD